MQEVTKGNVEEIVNLLASEEVEVILPERKTRKTKKTEKTKETEKTVKTIELLDFSRLDPLTRKLIRIGLLRLEDVEKVLKVEEEARQKPDEEDIKVTFEFMNRREEIQQIKKAIERQVEKIKEKGGIGLKIPYFVFRRFRPEITYKDLELLAKEISCETGERAEFEDGFLDIFIVRVRN